MNRLLKSTFWLAFLLTFFVGVYSECKFAYSNMPAKDVKAYHKLKPLLGRSYTAEDDEYTYHIGICTDPMAGQSGPDPDEAVVQIKKSDNKLTKSDMRVIGKYTFTSIMAGSNWVYLEYGKGENYHHHCTGEARKAVILFTCDSSATDSSPGMKVLEEENGKNSSCYYLFELAHPEVCAVPTSTSSLSIGSIILIVFFCVMSVYLIAGGLYQRFVLGAKGLEQIPNYEFWKDFGNLQADGCDFLCRTRDARNSSPYKGLGDDQLEEPEERDDNLLPM